MGWIQGRAYHQDLRERVFQVADAGTSVTGVAKLLRVSVSYVSKVLGRRRRTGETTARPQCGHVPAKLAAYHDAIRDRISAVPDTTLAELRMWLKETHRAPPFSAPFTLWLSMIAAVGLASRPACSRHCT
jgi:transposase